MYHLLSNTADQATPIHPLFGFTVAEGRVALSVLHPFIQNARGALIHKHATSLQRLLALIQWRSVLVRRFVSMRFFFFCWLTFQCLFRHCLSCSYDWIYGRWAFRECFRNPFLYWVPLHVRVELDDYFAIHQCNLRRRLYCHMLGMTRIYNYRAPPFIIADSQEIDASSVLKCRHPQARSDI
jgi:hypothetical protein